MGVPGLYRTIFQRYPGSVTWAVPGNDEITVDYFYLDHNPIIYVCYFNLCDSGKIGPDTPDKEVEKLLIIDVIKSTSYIVNELVKPTKLTYIALDGPAPKCKLVLQRFRRYKNLLEKEIKNKIQERYTNNTQEPSWSRSNITPGTRFMHNLNRALKTAVAQGIFARHPHSVGYNVMFSDSNTPGEGEHKITEHIATVNSTPDEKTCIYSNDGDMIILGCRFPRTKNIYVLTNPSFLPKSIVGDKQLGPKDYIYFNHNTFRDEVLEELEPAAEFDEDRIFRDLVGLSFLAGNDFVHPFPFLKMRYSHTFQTLLNCYREIVLSQSDQPVFLVNADGQNFDQDLLSDVFLFLAKQENFRMRDYQRGVLTHINRNSDWGPFETWEEEWSSYQHTYYYSKSHPEHHLVKDDFEYFEFANVMAKRHWKNQWYEYHFGFDSRDKHNYNKSRFRVGVAYIKSLIFTLRYYFNSQPPNWQWNYPYTVAPWPSDLLVILDRLGPGCLNSVGDFRGPGFIYTPFEQLLLTIPKQSSAFPVAYTSLKSFLPTANSNTVRLEMVAGEKYIYADPKIPSYNEVKLLKLAKKVKVPDHLKPLNKLGKHVWTREFN